MKLFLAAVLLGINLLCLTLLGCSIWPGGLENLGFFMMIGWLWMLPIALPAIAFIGIGLYLQKIVKKSQPESQTAPPRWRGLVIVTVAIMFATHILIQLNLPMQAAFSISEADFAAYASDAQIAEDRFDAAGLFERLGLYTVDYYAADPRGGTYFETSKAGPFRMSYGFAYQPNKEGSPFGDDVYIIEPLYGDWYRFRSLGE
ncbi:MAG: hypothetical protein AAF609_20380 [Cyanobacteria bacterium P01_C01_bin.120]